MVLAKSGFNISEEELQEWSIEKCNDWLNHPYNEPDRETDDSFDRAYRTFVKSVLQILKDRKVEK